MRKLAVLLTLLLAFTLGAATEAMAEQHFFAGGMVGGFMNTEAEDNDAIKENGFTYGGTVKYFPFMVGIGATYNIGMRKENNDSGAEMTVAASSVDLMLNLDNEGMTYLMVSAGKNNVEVESSQGKADDDYSTYGIGVGTIRTPADGSGGISLGVEVRYQWSADDKYEDEKYGGISLVFGYGK